MNHEEILSTLRDRRLALNLSQRDLSARIGISQADICGYEKGHVSPNLKNFAKLMEGLEIELLVANKEDNQVPLFVNARDLKMLREALCYAETSITWTWRKELIKLMREIDRHRPLGPDGKHGKLHTSTCGCEDK